MFLNPFPNAFGLDMTDLSIKLVQLKNLSRRSKGALYDLSSARQTKMPHGLVVNGVLEQPEKVRKYIKHLLQMPSKNGAITAPWVVASVPDSQGYMKMLHIEKDAEDIIEEDIVYAAKRDVPFNEKDDYIDWQIMPKDGHTKGHTDVLIATTPKATADMYTYLLESVGLIVLGLEIQSLATARAMITAKKNYQNEARAVLDIGATKSTLIIHDHDHLQFSRTLPFSGEIITTAIAQKLHISYDQAEERKKQYGMAFKDNPAANTMSSLANKLVQAIKETIDFYYSHFPNTHKITHITMCGGGAMLKNLDDILTTKLGIESAPGNVWKNLFNKKEIKISAEKSMSMATAIGLALRAADNPFFTDDII